MGTTGVYSLGAGNNAARCYGGVDAILTPEERTVFQLFFLNDYSTKETAQHTGSTHDAVRGRIARIRKKLRKLFLMCAVLLLRWNI